jgi:hypothetical protein
MNRKELRNQIGQNRRLRPKPRNTAGDEIDDHWEVISADDTELVLRNLRSGQEFKLGYDHIHEYRTPNFLILKSTVSLLASGPELEPIVVPPKITLVVAAPLPAPVQEPDGTWTREIHVRPSRAETVPDATVEVIFQTAYRTASYEVVGSGQAMILRELFGVEGTTNSSHFRMGLVELPRGTWLRLSFHGVTPPEPRQIRLTPYFKY